MTSIPIATPDAPEPADDGPRVRRAPWQSKWLLPGAAVLCYIASWWLAGRLDVSRTHGFNGSLLASGGVIVNLIVAVIAVFASLALGTIIASAIRPDAGLFAAAFALLAMSNRGRTVVGVLHEANGDSTIFLLLAVELLILSALIGAGWWALDRMQRTGVLLPDTARDGLADPDLPQNAGWQALGTAFIVTAVAVVLLAQTEDKKQVVAAVGLGAFSGAFFPYWQHGARPSAWYVAGPMLVGMAAYLFAFASPPVGVEVGRPDLNGAGILGALARPLPLDYAGMGTAGALLGYWMRRNSLRDREAHARAQALPTDVRQRLHSAGQAS